MLYKCDDYGCTVDELFQIVKDDRARRQPDDDSTDFIIGGILDTSTGEVSQFFIDC